MTTQESRKYKKWTTTSIKEVYDNPWIRLEHHEVVNPNGHEGIYGKVSFKNYAIGVIPLDDNNYTWLVGQYRYTLGQYSWEIPMGGGLKDQDPLISAQRELREETGLTAQNWECIMTLHTSNCVTDETGYIFVARELSQGATDFDDSEDLQIRHLPFDEVYEMVMSGKITDAITIAGILKYRMLQKK